MKKLFFSSVLLTACLVSLHTQAQQWSGNNTTTDPITRTGPVNTGRVNITTSSGGGGGPTGWGRESGLQFTVPNSTTTLSIGSAGSNSFYIGRQGSSQAVQTLELDANVFAGHTFGIRGNSYFAGNVGIGTVLPHIGLPNLASTTTKLQVSANGTRAFEVLHTATGDWTYASAVHVDRPTTKALSVIHNNTETFAVLGNGNIYMPGWLHMGTDLWMKRNDATNGDVFRRALVHGVNKELVLNYASDFSNGVFVDGPKFTIAGNLQTNGKVGIGTATPVEQFQIGDRWTFHNGGSKLISYNAYYADAQDKRMVEDEAATIRFGGGSIRLQVAPKGVANSSIEWTSGLTVQNDGKVVIGSVPSTPDGYRLYVENGILAERAKVAIKTTSDWSDYVFADTYKLRPLATVESYIQQHKHLPDVPSAEEMVTNGLDVAKTDALLLQKIEELTLYLIELNKKVVALEKENAALKNK